MKDKEIDIAVLADAIDEMKRQLVLVGSQLALPSLEEIRPIALASLELLEACAEAFEFFDNHGDGAPDAGGIGHESLRLAAQCRAALEKAGVKV